MHLALSQMLAVGTGNRMVAAGAMYTVVLRNDGTVWATGYNQAGQLGAGSKLAHIGTPVPMAAAMGSGNTAIAAGFSHTVILRLRGTARLGKSGALQYAAGVGRRNLRA